ncbi:MAG: TetR/AcrR family transcriptional regulator [Proteobacteria bacterium]|nr:TetR/AcrR family transcriptional regulator [Pseudomonadota bacterium]MBU1582213.1 TetR/AcrR family transcriptional regulator [Pseudomonadota bacterium]MBU2455597.1 TetR/AcrR family transcriptional regulator [Pseudomonadota bacterium]MBU2627067.1 TetR/AcrR family transcriptional regulator [Pseudomonadota bacterium]
MKQDTKQKIIETGAKVIHHKGYHHTGIQEILTAANVPKGSFYFYFASKEDFGLHVIDYYNTLYMKMVSPIITDSSIKPLEKINQLLDWFIHMFVDMEYQCGCPIGNLSQEMGDLSPVFSDKLVDSVNLIVTIYQDLLEQARQDEDIPADLDPRETADFIVSSWHGALIKMKIVKNATPLENHKSFILRLLAWK